MKGWRKTGAVAGIAVAAALAGHAGPLAGVAGAQEPGTDNQATRLETIVVTATRMEVKVSEQASAVSVVARDKIETESPPLAGDVLKGLPGVDVQRSGSPGNLENIRIRGGSSRYTLVMIDGFPVNSPTSGEFDIGSLPADGFERIEVVRGAQSALYGSNAMSGVVNFIPRRAKPGVEAAAGVETGSRDTFQWKGYARGAGSAGGLHLGASGVESDGILPNDDVSLASFIATGELSPGRGHRVNALVLSTDQEKGIAVDFGNPRDGDHRQVRRDVMGGARWTWDASRLLTVEASASVYDEFLHDEDPDVPGEASFSDAKIDTRKTLFRLQGRISPWPTAITFVGVEYLKDEATDVARDPFGGFAVSESSYNRSAYLQEELRVGKRAGLSLGARLDRNSEAGTEFNPRAAAFCGLGSTGARVRAAVGRGFQVPTLLDKFFPFIGNPGLSPEVAVTWEAGLDAPLPGRRGSVSATWFYQDFRDRIQFGPSFRLENVSRAFARGIEAGAEIRLAGPAALELSYTWTDTWNPDGQERLVGVPSHKGMASLLVDPAPGLTGRIDCRIESDQLERPLNGTRTVRPGYAVLDAYARWAWDLENAVLRQAALTAKVLNLLDRDYEERIERPAPGIGFYAGAELKI